MVNYDGRKFRKQLDDPTEDAPIAQYHQKDNLVWAEFAGGDCLRGSLAGLCDESGQIEFAYSMVLVDGDVISGRSVNTPELLPDGRIRLHEQWERYGKHADRGISYLEEVR
ncbi:MAG: hypothetical protein J2O49_01145 [Sciscionella sp.]|nr:hypothetical protein [Sciscionella sp.]